MSKEIREGTGDVKSARDEAAWLAAKKAKASGESALLAALVVRNLAPTRRYDEEATRVARSEARGRVQRSSGPSLPTTR